MFRAFFLAWLATWVGFVGAIAFNPDDGVVLRSDPLWTFFGIGAYLAAVVLYLVAAIILVVFILRGARRLCRRGVTSLP